MRILAIDPGSKLGWATDATGRLEWGTENFTIRNGESSGNRWRRFGEWLESVSTKPDDTQSMLTQAFGARLSKIDLVVYERAMFMTRARAAAEIAAGFTTRLEEHCERHGIALQPVAVQTLKAFALPKVKRKKGDPKMDRSKDAMIRAAMKMLANEGIVGRAMHDAKPGEILSVKVDWTLTEHEADALWLYWYCKEVIL